jgi:hypothetical protein
MDDHTHCSPRYCAFAPRPGDIGTPRLPELHELENATRDNPAIWKSGAKRSAPKPEWSLMPWNALREVLRRFEVGKKYGVHNWKKAQTSDDVDYVRQFDAHSFEHYRAFLNLIDKPAGAVSEKGDNLVENLAASVWNQLTLLDYLLENEGLVRAALSRYAEGDPRRFDAPEPTAEVAEDSRKQPGETPYQEGLSKVANVPAMCPAVPTRLAADCPACHDNYR